MRACCVTPKAYRKSHFTLCLRAVACTASCDAMKTGLSARFARSRAHNAAPRAWTQGCEQRRCVRVPETALLPVFGVVCDELRSCPAPPCIRKCDTLQLRTHAACAHQTLCVWLPHMRMCWVAGEGSRRTHRGCARTRTCSRLASQSGQDLTLDAPYAGMLCEFTHRAPRE